MRVRMYIQSVIAFLMHPVMDTESGVRLTGGESVGPAYVGRIRLWNLLEPVALLAGFMGLVIFGEYWLSKREVFWSLFVLAVWAMFISPLVHYPFEKHLFLSPDRQRLDYFFFECRGLGNPFRYFFPVNGDKPHFLKYLKSVLLLLVLFNVLFLICQLALGWGYVHTGGPWYLTGSISKGLFLSWGDAAWFNLALLLLWNPFMVRMDNLRSSLPYAAVFCALVLGYVVMQLVVFLATEPWLRPALESYDAIRLYDETAWERLCHFNPLLVVSQWAGYSFFGCAQQLIFCCMFAVPCARAFDVEHSRGGRFLACLIPAVAFGLFHYPNVFLGLLTFTGGLVGSYLFLQCRNMFVFGVMHGLLGAIANHLLPISFGTRLDHFLN